MSNFDQCPSHDHDGPHQEGRMDSVPRTGRQFWHSLDEVVETPEFRDFLEREFPARASELLDSSRRSFLKVMGASVALATGGALAACRRPDLRILAYNKSPEGQIPGAPLYYATALPKAGGGAEGVLAKTIDGRPLKIEGNPLHPYNRGKSSVLAQATVLGLYDPDRNPAQIGLENPMPVATWDQFLATTDSLAQSADANEGAGLAFLVGKATSPSREEMKRRIQERWPKAQWFAYDATDDENARAGAMLAFAAEVRPEYHLEDARVVVSIDRDILSDEGGLDVDRGWGASRYRSGTTHERSAADAEMNRLYAVESRMTVTGGLADHRLPLRVDGVTAFTILLAEAVLTRAGGGPLKSLLQTLATNRSSLGAWSHDIPAEWIESIAEDLANARGASLVVAGRPQPPIVHALVHAMNEALSNVGRTVVYRPVHGDAAGSSGEAIVALARAMGSGQVQTLVMLSTNPVYDAPADLHFGELLAKVPTSIHLGDHDETGAAAKMHLASAHALESWGDVEDFDGTYSVVQPMIAPLWEGHSEIELLSAMLGEGAEAYEIVRSSFSKRIGVGRTIAGTAMFPNPAFESAWRRCLHDGLLQSSVGSNEEAKVVLRVPPIEAQLPKSIEGIASRAGKNTLDVIFVPGSRTGDGRWANNGWLQELPDSITKNTWDNPVLISKATAERLGVATNRNLKGPKFNYVEQVELTVDGKTQVFPVWIMPGLADDTLVVTLGYGRTRGGRIAVGTGVSGYTVRTADAPSVAHGATLAPAKGADPVMVANTQNHWALDGRDVFREIDLYWWKKHGDEVAKDHDSYGRERTLVGGERLGLMETHAPALASIYKTAPGRGSALYWHKVNAHGAPVLDAEGRLQRPENDYGKPIQQWGMSIDLNACTGCGACTTACQAENNIPVVGKWEVAKGREMHWIRVDRYFATDTMDEAAYANPSIAVQPVPCMQCENAPCEVVCPVNATVHSREGTNDMAYNRCIGTRYCSNNCPYKVRRFNFFDYATKQYKGNYSLKQDLPEGIRNSFNTDLIPPRLREKVIEVQTMQNNPHVTVRSRGVMEKCTYCMQRINLARVETKLHDLAFIPDGFFQTACQQACPSNAIVFGDIYDYTSNDGNGSKVVQAKNDPRTFAMLAFLNTTPRTTYQVRVRNPNERLRPRGPNPFGHHGASHGEDHHEESHESHHSDAGVRFSLPILTTSRAGALA